MIFCCFVFFFFFFFIFGASIKQVTTLPELDAKLSDICISTSAAPTYLPAHYFTNKDIKGNDEEFNLIDGGVAANNPVMFHPLI